MKISSSSTCPSFPSSQVPIWNHHSFFNSLFSFTFFMILPIRGVILSRNVQLLEKDEVDSYIPRLELQLKTNDQDPLRRRPPFQRFVSSEVLQSRSSDNEDSTDGGSLIITLDIVLLSFIAVVIIAFVLFEFYRKVKRKSKASLPIQTGSLPMLDLGTRTGTENISSTTLGDTVETFSVSNRIRYSNTQNTPHTLSNTDVLEDTREIDNISDRESLDSIDHYSSHGAQMDEDDDHMSLTRPPPSALTSTRSRQSSPNTMAPSNPGTSYAIPDMYGDPYPNRNRERDSILPGKGPSSNSTHSRNSFMSFMTLSRFPSNHTFPDEPALTDTRSQVLARDLSQSSSGTLRSNKLSKIGR